MKNPSSPPEGANWPPAPAIESDLWLNTEGPLTLESLRRRVVVLYSFQMLCPGCIYHGLPQVKEIQRHFDPRDIAVIGLHSVFEHHDVMTPAALRVFVHENRLTFPIAVDRPGKNLQEPLPQTMRAYGFQGTPSLILIDRNSRLRAHHFGHVSDLIIGAKLGELLAEKCT